MTQQPQERLARIEQIVESLADKMDRIERLLIGNGSPGIITRVDRIEQNMGAYNRLTWLAISGMVTGFLGLFWKALK